MIRVFSSILLFALLLCVVRGNETTEEQNCNCPPPPICDLKSYCPPPPPCPCKPKDTVSFLPQVNIVVETPRVPQPAPAQGIPSGIQQQQTPAPAGLGNVTPQQGEVESKAPAKPGPVVIQQKEDRVIKRLKEDNQTRKEITKRATRIVNSRTRRYGKKIVNIHHHHHHYLPPPIPRKVIVKKLKAQVPYYGDLMSKTRLAVSHTQHRAIRASKLAKMREYRMKRVKAEADRLQALHNQELKRERDYTAKLARSLKLRRMRYRNSVKVARLREHQERMRHIQQQLADIQHRKDVIAQRRRLYLESQRSIVRKQIEETKSLMERDRAEREKWRTLRQQNLETHRRKVRGLLRKIVRHTKRRLCCDATVRKCPKRATICPNNAPIVIVAPQKRRRRRPDIYVSKTRNAVENAATTLHQVVTRALKGQRLFPSTAITKGSAPWLAKGLSPFQRGKMLAVASQAALQIVKDRINRARKQHAALLRKRRLEYQQRMVALKQQYEALERKRASREKRAAFLARCRITRRKLKLKLARLRERLAARRRAYILKRRAQMRVWRENLRRKTLAAQKSFAAAKRRQAEMIKLQETRAKILRDAYIKMQREVEKAKFEHARRMIALHSLATNNRIQEREAADKARLEAESRVAVARRILEIRQQALASAKEQLDTINQQISTNKDEFKKMAEDQIERQKQMVTDQINMQNTVLRADRLRLQLHRDTQAELQQIGQKYQQMQSKALARLAERKRKLMEIQLARLRQKQQEAEAAQRAANVKDHQAVAAKVYKVFKGIPVRLVNGWRRMKGWDLPRIVLQKGTCTLFGMIRGRSGMISRLHPKCRPTQGRLSFGVMFNNKAAQVDILRDGRMVLVSAFGFGWLSLQGIQFKRQIPPEFRINRNQYFLKARGIASPNLVVANGECVLSGFLLRRSRIKNEAADYLGRFDPACRPTDRIVFHVHTFRLAKKLADGRYRRGRFGTTRVDVMPDGRVIIASGSRNRIVSLNGISFIATDKQGPLELSQGWSAVPGYRAPLVVRVKRHCHISGFVTSASREHNKNPIAQLPTNCRPRVRQVHVVNAGNGATARVDVLPTGHLYLRFPYFLRRQGYRGPLGQRSISLSSIRVVVGKTQRRLRLVNRFRTTGAISGRAGYTRYKRKCVLRGIVYGLTGSKRVPMAQLPFKCRPRTGTLSYTVFNGGVPARLLIRRNGLISLAGRARGWINLEGVVIPTKAYPRFHLSWRVAGRVRRFRRHSLSRHGPTCTLSGVLKLRKAPENSEIGAREVLGRVSGGRCKPVSRQVFWAPARATRVSRLVLQNDGRLLRKGGDRPLTAVLGGLSWFPFGGRRVKVNKPWRNRRRGFPRLRIRRYRKFCFLGGVVSYRPQPDQNGKVSFVVDRKLPIAILPKRCRPYRRTVIPVLARSKFRTGVARVDVLPSGEVLFVSRKAPSRYISFAGVRLQARGKYATLIKSTRYMVDTPIVMANGWSNVNNTASHRKTRNHCVLTGVVRGSNPEGPIGHVDRNCRPRGRLAFAILAGGKLQRVDILRDGSIELVPRTGTSFALPLDGISYDVYRGRPMRLTTYWKRFGRVFRIPSYRRVLNHCALSGMTHSVNAAPGGQPEVVARLPRRCRPRRRLVFNAIGNGQGLRVDVTRGGEVILTSRPRNSGDIRIEWLSFDGIHFAVDPGVNLRPAKGVRNYWRGYGRLKVHRVGPYCVASGLAKTNPQRTRVTRLPRYCRPRRRFIRFTTRYGRVVVSRRGVVRYYGKYPRVSLSGIKFRVRRYRRRSRPPKGTHNPIKAPIVLVNGWRELEDANYAKPGFRGAYDICGLHGSVTGSSGQIGELPEQCRPRFRMMYTTMKGGFPTRVDVFRSGKIFQRNGITEEAPLSLSGMVLPRSFKYYNRRNVGLRGDTTIFPKSRFQRTRVGPLCHVMGVISPNGSKYVGRLDRFCRPRLRRVYIVATSNIGPVPVTITNKGGIYLKSEDGVKARWVSIAASLVVRGRLQSQSWLFRGWRQAYIAATKGKDGKHLRVRRYRGHLRYQVSGRRCVLTGLVYGTKLAFTSQPVITRLPYHCRPSSKQSFTIRAGIGSTQHISQVEVWPNGVVILLSPNHGSSLLSLDGVSFWRNPWFAYTPQAMQRPRIRSLPIYPGYRISDKYGRPSVLRDRKGICVVSGFVRERRPTDLRPLSPVITRLPRSCRPSGDLFFNIMRTGESALVKIESSGRITMVSGGQIGWVSLAGIVFSPASTPPPPTPGTQITTANNIMLVNNWVDVGNTFRPVQVRETRRTCILSGRIAGDSYGVVGALPTSCAPRRKLLYSVANTHLVAQVKVSRKGNVVVSDGSKEGGVSLDGVVVTKRGGRRLRLRNGWTRSRKFARPAVAKDGNMCYITGLANVPRLDQLANSKVIARVPWWCRPHTRLVFGAAEGGVANIRVDVLPRGWIVVKSAPKGSIVSLSNLRWASSRAARA